MLGPPYKGFSLAVYGGRSSVVLVVALSSVDHPWDSILIGLRSSEDVCPMCSARSRRSSRVDIWERCKTRGASLQKQLELSPCRSDDNALNYVETREMIEVGWLQVLRALNCKIAKTSKSQCKIQHLSQTKISRSSMFRKHVGKVLSLLLRHNTSHVASAPITGKLPILPPALTHQCSQHKEKHTHTPPKARKVYSTTGEPASPVTPLAHIKSREDPPRTHS